MFTTYEVLKDAFGPPAACWTNEAVTCKWGLRFNDDDDNVIHVIIYDSPQFPLAGLLDWSAAFRGSVCAQQPAPHAARAHGLRA